ncbi:MAG: hypothetical protein EOP48_01215 [Sphingobacteriales bacterium]|nr:MAG: hypothetical protein EOP48_01215 [Sphingobacteriales bacterium]
MPPLFRRLNRNTNRFFHKIDTGANRFFKKQLPGAVNTVGHGIVKAADTVANGIEKAAKSGILTDALEGAAIVASPFTAGGSLALAGAGASLGVANDLRRKGRHIQTALNGGVTNGKQQVRNSISQINKKAIKGIQSVSSKIDNAQM